MNQKELQKQLFLLKDEKYKKFHKSLCPGVENIIGIRVPILRKFAKELEKNNLSKDVLKMNPQYYEEKMLQGMLIGFNKKISIQNILEQIEEFIPKIDNWAVCDTFCAGLKITNKYSDEVWEFLQRYLGSNKEFELRFVIVMILDYYVKQEYLKSIFKIVNGIKHDGYYVKMAVAWLVSVCYIKYPTETLEYLKTNNLDDWTYNKSIQKIIESYRVDEAEKDVLRKMKKK